MLWRCTIGTRGTRSPERMPPLLGGATSAFLHFHEHWHWLWHHPFSELFASAGELLHDSLADSNLHGHRPAISRKQPPLVGSDMSQHSDPISALSNHLASPALLTSNGPLGAVWPFENGVFWLKATSDHCCLRQRSVNLAPGALSCYTLSLLASASFLSPLGLVRIPRF